MTASPRRSETWATVVWTVLSLAIFTGMVAHLWHFTIDDTYISARYARNLADGYGLVFSPGEQPSEGYSNLLWVLLLAGLTRLGVETIVAAKAVALLCGYLTVIMALVVAGRIVPALHGPAGLLCAASMPLALWSADGLGTSLMALTAMLWLHGAVGLMLHPERRRGYWLLGMASAAAPLIRPEGLLMAALWPLVLLMWRRATGRTVTWAGPLLLGVGLCLLQLWRMHHFGLPLPLPFYHKVDPGSLAQKLSGVLYLHRFIWQYLGGALGYLALVYGLLALRGRWPEDRLVGLALLAATPWLLFVLAAGSDWMPQYRFLVPAIAPLYILIMAMLARAVALLQISRRMARGFLAASVATVLVGSGFGAFGALQTDFWHSSRTEQISFHAAATVQCIRQGKWLAERGGPELTVAALDVGAVGYYSNARIIDIHGLTSPDTAGRDPHRVAQYVLRQRPDYIQVYSHPLCDDPQFRRWYQPVTEVTWHLYERIAD